MDHILLSLTVRGLRPRVLPRCLPGVVIDKIHPIRIRDPHLPPTRQWPHIRYRAIIGTQLVPRIVPRRGRGIVI
jgi:hypothetical protein